MGDGTVFEVANDANHTLSTLATFNSANGAGLIADAAGNLYGTTYEGGYGTVFELSPVPEPTSLVLGLVGGALVLLSQ
jgi:hypothetical protein